MYLKHYTTAQLLDSAKNTELLTSYRKACKEEVELRTNLKIRINDIH